MNPKPQQSNQANTSGVSPKLAPGAPTFAASVLPPPQTRKTSIETNLPLPATPPQADGALTASTQ